MNKSTIINMIFNRKMLAVVAALSMAASAFAQEDLKQEITVTHHDEVKPTDAVRLNVSPAVSMPPLQSSRLSYGTRQVKVGVPASIATLAPASYADTIYRSPFRGYAAAGYMPMFNLGASAGYKFIDNDRVRLNGWLQYDGNTYRGDLPWQAPVAKSVRLRKNVATVGFGLHSAVGRESFLDLGVDYTFARFNAPTEMDLYSSDDHFGTMVKNQNVHRLNVSGLWTMSTGKWNSGIGVGYGHFAYVDRTFIDSYLSAASAPSGFKQPDPLHPARENRFTIRAFTSAKVWGAESAGLEAKFSLLRNSESAWFDYTRLLFLGKEAESHGLLSLRPFYRTTWNHVALDLGLNLDFTFNNGKAFHMSPAAQATWKPSNFVSLYIKANGGERQNTLSSLFDVTSYSLPNLTYDNSHLVLDGEIGVTIGLFRGFYSQISAGYAIANDWLMPRMLDLYMTTFDKVNMKGYKFHFGLGYRYRNMAEISAAFEMAPNKMERGYYLWRDRAAYVAQANLRVTPIDPLDITVGWDYRAGRRVASGCNQENGKALGLRSLGAVNSLSLGANYRLTDSWTVWTNVENLLNHRYFLIGAMPAQGIKGLVGVTYKF